MTDLNAIDLFAGPGGWDVGARELGIDPLGIEWDDAACRVREAAGLRTLQADVAELDPLDVARQPLDLLIASPPCTAFSMAGKGAGRDAIDAYDWQIDRMAAGDELDREWLDTQCEDETAHLVLEPLRLALAIQPTMVALEQVPPVLPLWAAMGRVLRRLHGYHVWVGKLTAEQYGVPQTRERAFLIAHRTDLIEAPAATHKRYIAPRQRDDEGGGLFDMPDPERIVAPGERHLLDWISMAEALGWNNTDRVGFPRLADEGAATTDGYRERDFRTADQPAFNLTEKARSWSRYPAAMRAGAQEKQHRPLRRRTGGNDHGGNDHGERVWVPPVALNTGRDWKKGGTREDAQAIPVDQPAPAITPKLGGQAQWVYDRPAATVQADSRIWPPGHKVNAEDQAAGREGYGDRKGTDAIRVTEEEAACLQSFPDGYPWQAAGTRSAAFRCIGNAVPPLLARAVLQEVLQ